MEELEELECPAIKQPVTDDKFMILSETGAIPVPLEPFPWLPMNNHGNYRVVLLKYRVLGESPFFGRGRFLVKKGRFWVKKGRFRLFLG